MDGVSILVTALALGATEIFKKATGELGSDLYAGLKGLIRSRFKDVNISELDRAIPGSDRQVKLREDLTHAGAASYDDAINIAKQILDLSSSTTRLPADQVLNIEASKIGRNLSADSEGSQSISVRESTIAGDAAFTAGKTGREKKI